MDTGDKEPTGTGAGAAVRERSTIGTLSHGSDTVPATETACGTSTIFSTARSTAGIGLAGIFSNLLAMESRPGYVSSPSSRLSIGTAGMRAAVTEGGTDGTVSGRTGAAAGSLWIAGLSTAGGSGDKVPAGTGAGAAVRKRTTTGTLSTDSESVPATETGRGSSTKFSTIRSTVVTGLAGEILHLIGLWSLGLVGLPDLVGLTDRVSPLFVGRDW